LVARKQKLGKTRNTLLKATEPFRYPAYKIALFGPSGSGKSMSFRNLDPDRVVIIDTECKGGFPFDTKALAFKVVEMPPKPGENPIITFRTLLAKAIPSNTEIIVMDSSSSFIDSIETFNSKLEGFDFHRAISDSVRQFMDTIKSIPIGFVCTSHLRTDTYEGESKPRVGMYCTGKWRERGLESAFLGAWFSHVNEDSKDGHMHKLFTGSSSKYCTKSPPKWKLPQLVPNDLQAIYEHMYMAQK
jgi:hypothetical protein